MTCINFTLENIIECCSTYFGTRSGGLKSMFVDLAYLQLDDGAFDNEDCNQDQVDEVDIVDIGVFATMDEDGHCDNVDVPKGSSTPMDPALVHLHETMAKIVIDCGEGACIELCDHATSLLQ